MAKPTLGFWVAKIEHICTTNQMHQKAAHCGKYMLHAVKCIRPAATASRDSGRQGGLTCPHYSDTQQERLSR